MPEIVRPAFENLKMSARNGDADRLHIIQAMLDNTTAVIYAKDSTGRYQLVNRRFEELFGISSEQAKGRTDFDIFPSALAQEFFDNDQLVAQKNEQVEFEETANHGDGPHTYISLKFPYHDEQGACLGTCGISTDITPRKTAEAALLLQEQHFHQLADNVPECFWITEVDTWKIQYVNPSFERIWGRTCQELYEDSNVWLETIHPADRERVSKRFFNRVKGGNYAEEYRITRADGTIRWISDRGFPVLDQNGRVYRVAGIAQDITTRRTLEQQVTEISSQERFRISTELHDSLGQQLTGLGFLSNKLTRRLESSSSENLELAEEILDGIQTAIAEVRRIVRGLAPVNFDKLGLPAALEALSTSVRQYSEIDCRFVCYGEASIDDNTVANQLYRIAQEATNNAVKHADATVIVITLRCDETSLQLEVRDNGSGFMEDEHPNGMGLQTMRYRGQMIGADFDIESNQEETIITCVANRGLRLG